MRVKAVLLLFLFPLISCISEESRQGEQHRISMRFVEQTGEEFFADSGTFLQNEALIWGFGENAEPPNWQPFPRTSEVTVNRDSLTLCSESRRAHLGWDADFLADDIQALDVRATGPGLSRARLCWETQPGSGTDEGCAVARRNDRGLFTFEVLKHPEWSGRIKRISLTPLLEKAGCTEVYQITGKSYRTEPETLKAALERSWKVTLMEGPHGVTRDSLLALPGEPIVRRVLVGPRPILRFSYGLEPGVRGPVTFVVNVQSDSKSSPETVFEETIQSENVLQGSGWRQARIDLRRFAGRQVDLILETVVDQPSNIIRGFPVWGHPELLEGHLGPDPINLILISVDTLRADHMSLYGYDRQTTPNIDRWARQHAVTFRTAIAPSPWTIPSHASIFTGLDALTHGINHVQKISGNQTMLAEILREAGYQTAAITGGGFLAPEFGFSAGFDRYLHWNAPAVGENELASGIDHLLEWLESPPEGPFFFFFHTYEVHSPYRPREPFFSRFTGSPPTDSRLIGERNQEAIPDDGFRTRRQWIWLSDPTRLRQGIPLVGSEIDLGSDYYDSQVGFLDSHLGHLLNTLETTGLAGKTVVIVTSDHGESLGEAGLMGHTNLQDSNLLVPLIIGLPAGAQGGRLIESPVRLIDILPTVVDLLEIGSVSDLDGESLVPLMLGEGSRGLTEVWSYAGKYNGGVSLRVGNQSKYFFNDTAWTSVWGTDELQQSKAASDRDAGAEMDRTQVEGFRTRVRDRLASTARGLQIDFNNPGLMQFSGHFSGEPIDASRLKSSGPTPNLVYRGGRKMSFAVPGEQKFDVILETPKASGKLQVLISMDESGRRSPYRTEIDLDPGREFWALCRRGDSWREETTAEHSECIGITLRWRNQPGLQSNRSNEVQPELLEQLEALGYVE